MILCKKYDQKGILCSDSVYFEKETYPFKMMNGVTIMQKGAILMNNVRKSETYQFDTLKKQFSLNPYRWQFTKM